jgi:molybdate transport system substrate-binding protein
MTSLLAISLIGLTLAMAPLVGVVGAVRAAELQVLAGGGIAAPMNELAKQFESATGHKLKIRYGTTPDLIKMATSGDPFDLAVVPREVFRDEAARAMIPGPTVDIARVGLGVAVHAGAAKPDISSEAAFKQALVSAKSIATIPASAGGMQVLKLFERLGIATETNAKVKAAAGPAELVKTMAAGEAELGLFLINVLTAPGIDVVGPVPAGLSQDIVYIGGVANGATDPAAARAFLDFLQTPEAKKVIVSKGMMTP